MSSPANIRDYFAHPQLGAERAQALRVICESWLGTPFRERSAVKGAAGGVDCASFIGASFFELGAIEEAISVPPYDINWALHSEDSMFRAWFERPEVRARVRRVDEDDPVPQLAGDMVFPKVGRTDHHIAIDSVDLIYHVARMSGVCAMTPSQLVLHRSRYRLLEP